MALAIAVVFFNGMGSTRAQGLRYANQIDTLKDGKLFYRSREKGDKFFPTVWPAEDFDDIHVEDVGTGIVHGEPLRASAFRRWMGVEDPNGFTFRLIPHKWFPPCSRPQIDKGLRDVRDALAAHEKVAIYGASRGAALALLVLSELSREERAKIHVVIAEAPFDNLANVISDRYGLPWIVRRLLWWLLPLGPLDVELYPDVPIVIGAATEDEACPFEGQQRLAQKLSTHPNFEFVVVEGAHHNNIWLDPKYRRVVKERCRSAAVSSSASERPRAPANTRSSGPPASQRPLESKKNS
jgi:dienelactone hydrolase